MYLRTFVSTSGTSMKLLLTNHHRLHNHPHHHHQPVYVLVTPQLHATHVARLHAAGSNTLELPATSLDPPTSRRADMALGKKAYPQATVKKIIKAHSGLNWKKNTDVTVSPAETRRARDGAGTPRLP